MNMSTTAISITGQAVVSQTAEVRPAAAVKAPATGLPAVRSGDGAARVTGDAETIDFEGMSRNLDEAIQKLNDQMKSSQRGLNFSKDQVNGTTVVKVMNSHTGEVVRQIPDVSLLRAAHSIEALKGMIHDEST
jgi:flagellar protein FlaG